MPETERIGFLGLGIMGSLMAASLRRAGFELTVWTHTPGKAKRWAAAHGASAAATPAEVAESSEVTISMVVDGEQVSSLLLGANGVLEGARPGLLHVDCSTIAPRDARRLSVALQEREAALLDAPVTGSTPKARDGTLTIMVGGSEADLARGRPVLEAMGELIVHVGEIGQGQMAKVISNSISAANASAVAEALIVADATGVDIEALLQICSGGSAASRQLELKAGAMRGHDYRTLFKTEHMLKDVRLCLEEAQVAGVPFPAAGHARDLLTGAVGRGHGGDDYAAIIEAAEGLAGRRL